MYRLAQQAALPGFKLTGTWRFRHSEVGSLDCAQSGREGVVKRIDKISSRSRTSGCAGLGRDIAAIHDMYLVSIGVT